LRSLVQKSVLVASGKKSVLEPISEIARVRLIQLTLSSKNSLPNNLGNIIKIPGAHFSLVLVAV
jgi:hypothetical protein